MVDIISRYQFIIINIFLFCCCWFSNVASVFCVSLLL